MLWSSAAYRELPASLSDLPIVARIYAKEIVMKTATPACASTGLSRQDVRVSWGRAKMSLGSAGGKAETTPIAGNAPYQDDTAVFKTVSFVLPTETLIG